MLSEPISYTIAGKPYNFEGLTLRVQDAFKQYTIDKVRDSIKMAAKQVDAETASDMWRRFAFDLQHDRFFFMGERCFEYLAEPEHFAHLMFLCLCETHPEFCSPEGKANLPKLIEDNPTEFTDIFKLLSASKKN